MKNEWKYYVYELVDPRNQEVFYVGKGCGNRMYKHVLAVRRGRVDNPAKCQRIREILDFGLEVEQRLNAVFMDERSAFSHEADLISERRGQLTNNASGNDGGREAARSLLSLVIPFEKWCARYLPSMEDIESYWVVVNGLKEVAVGLCITELTFDRRGNLVSAV